MSGIINAELFAAMLRVATPLLLVALGGLMCQRAEIFNIGIEGYMLMGAFFAIFFIDRFGNSWMGLIGGILGGTGLCMVYALFVIKFKANHILTSIAVNYLSTGLTTFLLIPIYGVKGGYRPEHMEMLPTVDIPFVEEIPFVGKVLSGHTVTVYLGLALIVITWFILFKTPFGMLVRSVGSNPDAVRTAGVRPETVQFLVILWCGILCGLAGAHLSTGYASEFTENITQGRGFTAFSAIVFGGAHPVYCFLACLVFGLADVIGIRFELANVGVSPSIIKMFPYALAITVLAVSSLVRIKRRSSSTELF